MKKPVAGSIVSALLTATLLLPFGAANAQEKHESNTLRKIGKKLSKGTTKAAKATEYSTRKIGENTTLATHRALGKKTRVHNRGKKQDVVITGDGKHIPVKRK